MLWEGGPSLGFNALWPIVLREIFLNGQRHRLHQRELGLELPVPLHSSYIREAPYVHQQPFHASHVLLSILVAEPHPFN